MKDLLIIISLLLLLVVIYTLFTRMKRNPPQVGSSFLQGEIDRKWVLKQKELPPFFISFYINLKVTLFIFAPMIAGWLISLDFYKLLGILMGQILLATLIFEWLRSCLNKINGINHEPKDWDESIYKSGIFIAGLLSFLVICRDDILPVIEKITPY